MKLSVVMGVGIDVKNVGNDMTFENRRGDRMQKIIELLEKNPDGLRPETIAKETNVLMEITKDRLFKYIDELQWAGKIVKLRDGRVKLR